MPKSPKSAQKDLDSSLVINTLMNLSQRTDKAEWRLSDLTTRCSAQETEQSIWKSRFHDIALVGVLGLLLLLIVSFYFWRHIDSRLDLLESGFTSLSKEAAKKDSHMELKIQIEKTASRVDYLEKLLEEKTKSVVSPHPETKPKK
jgi:hypothetical protein